MRRYIDFMSNCQDMTTATCQSTRIVLGVETIDPPIHIAVAPIFFRRVSTLSTRTKFNEDDNKIRNVWKISGQHHAKRKKRRNLSTDRDSRSSKAFYRFSVTFSRLRHLIAFRRYQERITSRVTHVSCLFTASNPEAGCCCALLPGYRRKAKARLDTFWPVLSNRTRIRKVTPVCSIFFPHCNQK